MPTEDPSLQLELAHVLFMDLVGHSRLPMEEQARQVERLQALVRETETFQRAAGNGEILPLPRGDGMALVFLRDPIAHVRCATEIAQALCHLPGIELRMGLHSGPIYRVEDINAQPDVSGGGINFAQRVMDCGDAGHILLSRAVAECLIQLGETSPSLRDLGECEVKHGVRLRLYNLYAEEWGNPEIPRSLCSGSLPLRHDVTPPHVPPLDNGIRVGHSLQELLAFGLSKKVLEVWERIYPDGLNDLQLQAVNDFRVLEGISLLVAAPTNAGKTFIGEMAAMRAVAQGKKAVFLFPYRALVAEKYAQFRELYGDELGLRVVRCAGDYLDQTEEFIGGRYDLALLTYEMFLHLTLSNPATLKQIGLVALDEAQFLSDPERGKTVELLLTRLIAARKEGLEPQIVALSAVLGASPHFAAWLGCATLVTEHRPVRLVEGVVDREGVFQYLDEAGEAQTTQMIPAPPEPSPPKKPSARDLIGPLVSHLVAQGEKVIVFRNQRGKVERCARDLAQALGLPPATETIRQLPVHDGSTSSADLRACLEGGTAFHDTNLNREERAVVERAFRDPSGPVRVLAATTTVAAGVNTPASTVVLVEHDLPGEGGRPLTIAEYKNMAGRAGRLGFGRTGGEEGKSILYAETSAQRQQLFERYVKGQVEPIRSSFNLGEIETWILRLLAQLIEIPKRELGGLLASTYGGYVSSLQDSGWKRRMKEHLDPVIDGMRECGVIETEGDLARLTLLGQALGRSSLSYRSGLRLVELLRSPVRDSLNPERLMALIQALPESDGGYTPMLKGSRLDATLPQAAASRFGSDIVALLQRYCQGELEYLARCKRACLLGDWMDGVPVEEIERRYTPNPYRGAIGHGDIRKFADTTRRHLRAAFEIVQLALDCAVSPESMSDLLKRLEVGVPSEALGLLGGPLPLTRGECIALFHAGIRTPGEYSELSPEELKERINFHRSPSMTA